MVRVNKIVSMIVLVCFLFNTASYDLAFGQVLNCRSNTDKLAAPSGLTDITGIQHKDMGRIKLALEEQLMFLWTNNVPSLIPIFMDEKINFKEKTIFQPADMQFFFHEIKLTNAGPCVMVRLKDKHGLRTYYATFSLRKDENGGFPVTIYTEKQYKNSAAFTKGVPRTKAEDTEAINRYVENNEKIIDTFIRERINAGDFVEVKTIVKELDLAKFLAKFPHRNRPKAYLGNFLMYAQINLEKFLNIFKTSVFDAFYGKNIVFIKVPKGVSYPVIKENGRSITVKSHTSENAVYFFLDSGSFELMKAFFVFNPLKSTGSRFFEKVQYNQIISAVSLETIVHEIGVSYGLPYEVTPDGEIVNDLDKAYAQYNYNLRTPANEISARFPRLKNLSQANLDHVKGRDYAAGDTKAAPQKGAVSPTYVYFFGNGETSAEGLFKENLDARKIILGGKGEGLHSMTRAKIPVPPGFTITTDACNYYYTHGQNWPNALEKEMNSNLAALEKLLNKKLGDNENPLLVSVRSGAKFSMPGMMDTILNLGLNDTTVLTFARKTGNDRLAWDSYRRFIQMFSDVVLGIEKKDFEKIIESKKEELGVKDDVELDAEALKDLVAKFKTLVESRGKVFPQDVRQQLIMAVNAVFESWNNPRAITYRNLNKIPHDLGTAVNVQAMVFGNTGNHSATGVGFTRNPSTGVKEPYGEFLINAQGEDVVAGIRTPQGVSQLKEVMPEVYSQLMEITDGLEKHYKDMQDFEFTIEDGKLYLLQTRSGKRTGVSAVKVVVDMVKEGLITKEEALMRVDPKQLNEVLFPILDPQAKKSLTSKEILATGLSAGPGAAAGQVVFTAEDAVKWTNDGKQVILWRKETCPDDIAGMDKAIGVGTSIGGMTSHAALVARGMGKVTMVGAGQVDVNYEKKEAYAKNEQGEIIHTLKEGDWITLNVVEKEKAQLILGKKDIVRPEAIGGELEEFLSWAKATSRLRVWANADIPHDARKAFSFGAEGIGLCRTEHMFFGEDRLPIMQEMILADSTEARESALDKLLPMQREDFFGLFREMKGYPVTIRTLDPPLHEFLPKREEIMVEIKELELTNADPNLIKEKKKLLSRINELHEFNPMMGMRGTRLGIMMPEITAMQARAIAEAAVVVIKDGGKVIPEIMIPLVGKLEEFTHQKKIVVDTVEKVMKDTGVRFQYRIGTMIEVPRGALTADELAKEAEFFSFGTNDLTQYGAGFSRDDIGKFMSHYLSLGIYPFDPFETFDAKGIGELVRIAVEKGRKTNPDLKIGVCGEHGGDPESIKFFHEVGLNYVSCSPYRVLGAWLAAAQAAIKEKLSKGPALPAKEAAGQSDAAKSAPAAQAAEEKEIAAMTPLASEAGKLLAPPSERYNLLVTWEFFANGELKEHRARYRDRFDLDQVSGTSFKQFVDNIMAKAAGKETKTIALVPNDLSAEQLERLTKAGIRFIRVNNIGLLKASMRKDAGREKFQADTYAMMLLLRRIDDSMTADSSIYRLLSFYLKSHFALEDKIAIDDYIMAVINNDIAKLIKGYLSYRPAQPYDVPDYNKVAASLISA